MTDWNSEAARAERMAQVDAHIRGAAKVSLLTRDALARELASVLLAWAITPQAALEMILDHWRGVGGDKLLEHAAELGCRALRPAEALGAITPEPGPTILDHLVELGARPCSTTPPPQGETMPMPMNTIPLEICLSALEVDAIFGTEYHKARPDVPCREVLRGWLEQAVADALADLLERAETARNKPAGRYGGMTLEAYCDGEYVP